MDRYGLVGVDYRRGESADRTSFFIPEEERSVMLPALRKALEVDELVYLATCNRVEVVTARHGGSPEGTVLRQRLLRFFDVTGRDPVHARTGPDAIIHLFRVAASLESMVVGEVQILGQVKESISGARAAGVAGKDLDRLFQRAFRVARQVRRETGLGTGSVSMASLAAQVALDANLPTGARATMVGRSEIVQKLARYLDKRLAPRFTWVNRRPDRARHLARDFGGEILSLDAFQHDPPETDLLVTATSAPHALFDVAGLTPLLRHRSRPLLVVDLAVPRDTDASLDGHANVRVVTVDTLRSRAEANLSERLAEVERASLLVSRGVSAFADILGGGGRWPEVESRGDAAPARS
jgi:glutamyl-tRNA reductase